MGAQANAPARLGDFSADTRILLLTAMAVLVGAVSAVVAYVLVWLISAITNLAYYHRLSGSRSLRRTIISAPLRCSFRSWEA